MSEQLPIVVVTPRGDLADIVYAAATRVGVGPLGELLVSIADELADEACLEIYDPNIPNEACRRRVAATNDLDRSSDIWDSALALARSILNTPKGT